jgi:hypothetical protein
MFLSNFGIVSQFSQIMMIYGFIIILKEGKFNLLLRKKFKNKFNTKNKVNVFDNINYSSFSFFSLFLLVSMFE